jgi:hypothetical protein
MPLVGAGAFTGIISSYRLLWISGRFGGGKTSFAYALAEEYLKQGYRLVSNNRSVWADNPSDVCLDPETGHLKAVIILDEGGLEFKAKSQIEQIAAYAAKMDCIYIIPSFWPPVRAAQVLTAQPLFSLQSAGLPVIVYRWRVKLGSFSDNGIFLWTWPNSIYGIYSREDPGDRSAQIVKWLVTRKNEFRKRYGYVEDDGIPEMGQDIGQDELLADAVDEVLGATDDIETLSKRIRRRR